MGTSMAYQNVQKQPWGKGHMTRSNPCTKRKLRVRVACSYFLCILFVESNFLRPWEHQWVIKMFKSNHGVRATWPCPTLVPRENYGLGLLVCTFCVFYLWKVTFGGHGNIDGLSKCSKQPWGKGHMTMSNPCTKRKLWVRVACSYFLCILFVKCNFWRPWEHQWLIKMFKSNHGVRATWPCPTLVPRENYGLGLLVRTFCVFYLWKVTFWGHGNINGLSKCSKQPWGKGHMTMSNPYTKRKLWVRVACSYFLCILFVESNFLRPWEHQWVIKMFKSNHGVKATWPGPTLVPREH